MITATYIFKLPLSGLKTLVFTQYHKEKETLHAVSS